ncbi:MAG TPA: hypothetical protein VGO29_05130 [Solirubrobacteraceae bacterium]|jgi:hypothetical protein|nr:hypothetical protein [Solirubrobacteraceae bacterium]
MDTTTNTSAHDDPSAPAATTQRRTGGTRLPSARSSALLATVMLGVGIAVGAAIGPAPEASIAGGAGIAQKLPALIASVVAHGRSQAPTPAATTPTAPPAIVPQATPSAVAAPSTAAQTTAASATPTSGAGTPAQATTPAAGAPGASETGPSNTSKPKGASNVPPITSVWLIELSGASFAQALANPAATPYISGQLLSKGTYLPAWSALSASGFANEAALVEHRAALGTTPPLLHSIVQPPCPEGAAGASCAAGTPNGLSAADRFLQATLATITATTTYSEHGLVVVTFATVADPTAAELAAGASTATLASQPPAGAVLLSPFAKAAARSTAAFDPTSPKQSLEKLLH